MPDPINRLSPIAAQPTHEPSMSDTRVFSLGESGGNISVSVATTYDTRAPEVPVRTLSFEYPPHLSEKEKESIANTVVGTAYLLEDGKDNTSNSRNPTHLFHGTMGSDPIKEWASLQPSAGRNGFYCIAPDRPQDLCRSGCSSSEVYHDDPSQQQLHTCLRYACPDPTDSSQEAVLTVWAPPAILFRDDNVSLDVPPENGEKHKSENGSIEKDGVTIDYEILDIPIKKRTGEKSMRHVIMADPYDIGELLLQKYRTYGNPLLEKVKNLNPENSLANIDDLMEALDAFFTKGSKEDTQAWSSYFQQEKASVIAEIQAKKGLTTEECTVLDDDKGHDEPNRTYVFCPKTEQNEGCESIALQAIYKFPSFRAQDAKIVRPE